MQIQFGPCLLELTRGDITAQETDAIVTAANAALAGGGGVDGAIHKAAGPSVMEECEKLYPDGCPTGSAVATSAGQLGCKHLFHAVGPVWSGGRSDERTKLASAYTECLQLARKHGCNSIAFPAISTGAYSYPVDMAAAHSLEAVRDFLIEHKAPEHVRFVLYSGGIYGAFAYALDQLIAAGNRKPGE